MAGNSEEVRDNEVDILINVVLVGDPGSGKRTIIQQFSGQEPYNNIRNGREIVTLIEAQKHKVKFHIWNTAGRMYDGKYGRRVYRRSDVIVICFSIDNLKSFNKIESKWFPEIQVDRRPGVPIIVVGNKKDLRDSTEDGENIKVAYKYMECCALSNEGIKEIFETVVQAHLKITDKKKKCTVQ